MFHPGCGPSIFLRKLTNVDVRYRSKDPQSLRQLKQNQSSDLRSTFAFGALQTSVCLINMFGWCKPRCSNQKVVFNKKKVISIKVKARRNGVKSSYLYLGRVALSAIRWYQKGPCVKLRLPDKDLNSKITFRFMDKFKN